MDGFQARSSRGSDESMLRKAIREKGILITFEQLGLSQEALASLAEVGFTEPTEIQGKTIGIVAERKDLIASAQTGSGKTAAYALPILDILRSEDRAAKPKTKALVIVPTRELALQVCGEFERFGSQSGIRAVALYGGTGYRKQVQSLHRGADIIVATPGRLMDCLNRNFASLAKLQVVVLDEADRLLDMGFMPQVRAVIARAPEQRQTLMFSATIDARMKKIAEEFLREPVVVAANQQKIEPTSIEQQFHYIKEAEKEEKLLELLLTVENGGSCLVFTKTRIKASKLTSRMKTLDILAEEIHGDISQAQRVRTLTRFRNGEFNVLIATDVAARGLDIPAISHVINYDLPMLAEDYVHRIGRTGRAGKSGIAHSFVSNDQRHLVRAIHQVLKNAGNEEGVDVNATVPTVRGSREALDYAERLIAGAQGARKPAGYGRQGRGGGANYRGGSSNRAGQNRHGLSSRRSGQDRQGSSHRRHENPRGGYNTHESIDSRGAEGRYGTSREFRADARVSGEMRQSEGRRSQNPKTSDDMRMQGEKQIQKPNGQSQKHQRPESQKKTDTKQKKDPKELLKEILNDAELAMFHANDRTFSRGKAGQKPHGVKAKSGNKSRSSWGGKPHKPADFKRSSKFGAKKPVASRAR